MSIENKTCVPPLENLKVTYHIKKKEKKKVSKEKEEDEE